MAHLNYLLVLTIIVIVMSAGIHIFSKGFLLTRVANETKSNCHYFINSLGECHDSNNKMCKGDFLSSDMLKSNLCFKQNSKVILIVIDALKYEFGVFDENISEPLPYQNKLSVLKELQESFPDHTRMLKFIADPPTTTLQRLKGITTGSLPTFIDMGSNFATPEINEDNVIYQAYSNNLTAVFLGDSTWTELFPKYFKRQFSYPSFNIHDLDTVDRSIEKLLPNEVLKDDWNLIIAHFLGVDHAGHRYGPLHQEMGRKLSEMNIVIKNLTELIDNETTLLVIGDHGMTRSGDHGGSSNDEVEALLFAYSKGKPFVSTSFDNDEKSIHQIDLAPTLSAILGLPIPYSNLGTLSYQLLPEFDMGSVKQFKILQHYIWQNARQVYNYIREYAQHDDNFENNLAEFLTNFDMFEHRVKFVSTDEAFMSFSGDLKQELKTLLDQCRDLWVKFNPHLMTHGLMLTFVTIFTMFLLIFGIPLRKYSNVYTEKLTKILIIYNIVSIILALIIQHFIFVHENLLSNVFIISLGNILILAIVIIQNWETIADELHLHGSFNQMIPRLHLILILSIFFSNSFIIREQNILAYMLASQIILSLFEFKSLSENSEEKVKSTSNNARNMNRFKIIFSVIVASILIRFTYVSFKCREEQRECWEDFSSKSSSSTEFELIPIALLIVFVITARIFLKVCGNLTGFSLHVIFIKFGLVLSLVAASAYLILTQKSFKSSIPPAHLDLLAQTVFVILILECLIVTFSPLMIYLIFNDNNSTQVVSDRNNIPEMYRLFKNIFNRKSETTENVPIVYGLASLYSSIFIALGTCLFVAISITMGKQAMIGFSVISAIAILVVFLASIIKFERSCELKNLMQPQFNTIITWLIVTSFGFYATSHQPTISQIEWDAAFVGRKSSFDHSSPISILLVLLNTFSCNILFFTIYPLLVIVPFMLGAVFPSLSKKVNKTKDEKSKIITLNEPNFEVARGEINLLENDKYFMSSVFKVGCQFAIFQGFKCFASMLACTVLCRHLMVWKIFAPRFIYEGIATYISFVCIIIGYTITWRINLSAKNFVEMINERKFK